MSYPTVILNGSNYENETAYMCYMLCMLFAPASEKIKNVYISAFLSTFLYTYNLD